VKLFNLKHFLKTSSSSSSCKRGTVTFRLVRAAGLVQAGTEFPRRHCWW